MPVAAARRRGVLVAALVGLALGCGPAGAQPAQTTWDTHEELRQWVMYPAEVPQAINESVEMLSEDGREFMRMRFASLEAPVFLGWPGGPRTHPPIDVLGRVDQLDPLVDPSVFNAVRVTLRHQVPGYSRVSGAWAHQGHRYQEPYSDRPGFGIYDLPGDGEWHDVTMPMTDSPHFDSESMVVNLEILLLPSDAAADLAEAWRAVGQTAVLDVDRIEFVSVAEQPGPVISSFEPKRGPWGTEVTINGSGFAASADGNIVEFDGSRLSVLSGDASHLVVKMEYVARSPITVRVPGGGVVTTAEPFTLYGRPASMKIVAGDGQEATTGAPLAPLTVQVLDRSKVPVGVPGERVFFRILDGAGTLSVAEGVTDDDGLASTVLTLGADPGVVRVEVEAERLNRKVRITATALP